MIIEWELYLDESGDFVDDTRDNVIAPSLVGGFLCRKGGLTPEVMNRIYDEYHGCTVKVNKKLQALHNVMEPLHENGIQYVVFENRERIKVVNPEITYINILSEGIAQLMQDLSVEAKKMGAEYATIKPYIAQRTGVHHPFTTEKDYKEKFEERLALSRGRRPARYCKLEPLQVEDAKKFKPFNLADMVCNNRYAWRKGSFPANEDKTIEELYDRVYSAFDTGNETYIRNLLTDERIGEAVFQLCAADEFEGMDILVKRAVNLLLGKTPRQLESTLEMISLELDNFSSQNNDAIRHQGIKIGENFLELFLNQLKDQGADKCVVSFCAFDTYFYLMTIYDHLGEISKCWECCCRCEENIDFLWKSMDHLDYYFNFCIRRLNLMKDNYAFAESIEQCRELEKTLLEVKDLYSDIARNNHEAASDCMKSALLGKVYGIQVQAYTNLIRNHPEMQAEAEMASDRAIAEFTSTEEVNRQYLYRCHLMLEEGKLDEAQRCLCTVCGIDDERQYTPENILKYAYSDNVVNPYVLLHYTNLMAEKRSKQMLNALLKDDKVFGAISSTQSAYPWNVINWNISRTFLAMGEQQDAANFYEKAMELSEGSRQNATMMTFAAAFSAEWMLEMEKQGSSKANDAKIRYESDCSCLINMEITGNIKKWFGLNHYSDPDQIRHNAGGYLK